MKHPRQHDGKYLDYIRSLPCVVCGDNTTVEAAHIRYGELRAAKRPTGMSEKPDDTWTLPLCGRHHREQHEGNERMFWVGKDIDPIFLALALCHARDDRDRAEQIVAEART